MKLRPDRPSHKSDWKQIFRKLAILTTIFKKKKRLMTNFARK